ncbi:MAG: serine/threonine-protein kinase [Polyangiaceae bacterium]
MAPRPPKQPAAAEPRPLPRPSAAETVFAQSTDDVRSASPLDAPPAILADLMVCALLRPGGCLVSLDPEGESAALAIRRGNATIAEFGVSGDVAAAAIGRLALMTGLDPLAERGSLVGPRAARLAVRVGGDDAEILVTLGATGLGVSAELRLLSLHGRAIEHRPLSQLRRCTSCGAFQPPTRERCEVDGGALRELFDDPKPGGTIGVYRLLSKLGEGATGEVFAAEHALIERRVAIKVLRASMVSEPASESRFLFEARAATRIHHPNVVEVTDYGVLPSGSPFIVMERLVGDSLERRLEPARALEPTAALRIARATALGLCAAHDGGVIHNDLKPSNVILLHDSTDEAPKLKIVDFGAASIAGAKDDGVIVGTAAYMAPERIYGEPSDVRSDVYSLGIMLYRMLSGRLPFAGETANAMFRAHVKDAPRPLTSPFGVLPGRVGRLLARALEKKPSERYQTMEQVVVDIDHALRSLETAGWRRWLP